MTSQRSRIPRLAALSAAVALAFGGIAVAGPAVGSPSMGATTQEATIGVAAPARTFQPTSKQLASWGFTKKPNLTAWAPGGTAEIDFGVQGHCGSCWASVPTWWDLYIHGKAPKGTAPGQVLTLKRFVPTNKSGDGDFTDLGITTTVNKDRTFTLHVQLGKTGLAGYSVGYETAGTSPEVVAFEFQLKVTAPASLRALPAFQPTAKQLSSWGFTTKPNVSTWAPGGTATLSATSAPAGSDVTLTGKAPTGTKAGQKISLKRFIATDSSGSGYFTDVNATTKVKKNGSYTLVFDLGLKGRYGYTVGYNGGGHAWVGVEFQLQTT